MPTSSRWRSTGIPSELKTYSRNVIQRGIDGVLASLKVEAERRTVSPDG
jgi:hypothetical protein